MQNSVISIIVHSIRRIGSAYSRGDLCSCLLVPTSLLSSFFLVDSVSVLPNLIFFRSLLSTLSHLVSFFLPPPLSFCFCRTLLQSQAGPTEVQTAGATARRASPQTMRCSLSRASEATPAQLPKNLTPLLQCLPPMNPPRKWIFLALMGRRSTARVLHLSRRLLQPQPLTS